MEEEGKEEESMITLNGPDDEEIISVKPVEKYKHNYSDDHPYKETWRDFKGVNNIELYEEKNSIPFDSEEFNEK